MTAMNGQSPDDRAGQPPPRQNRRLRLLKILIVCLALIGVAAESYSLVPAVRAWAVGQAARLGEPALPLVLKSLDDRDAEVREAARGAVKRIGPPAVPSLIQGVHDPAAERRLRALHALEQIGPEARDAQTVVTEALKDEDGRVRIAAARTLSAISQGTDTAVAELLAVLANEAEEAEVRAQAAEALGRLGPQASRAIPTLLRALQDPQDRLREKAAEAVGNIGVGTADVVVALADALDDPNAQVQHEAAEALQRGGITDVTPLIQQLSNKEPRKRLGAVRALILLRPRDRQILPALTALHKDADPRVRDESAMALLVIRASTSGAANAPAEPDRGPAP